ncbi:MAG TPA: complex I subunit 1 family protein [Deinococcales bacterium]|nr:complex I subunit 1 family protein [Deinococcales bacterium]
MSEANRPQGPLTSMPVPADRHYRLKMGHNVLINSDPRRSGVVGAVIGYSALLGASVVLVALIYAGLPWLLNAVFGEGTFWYTALLGIIGPVLAFLFVAVVALILILMLRKYLGKVQNRYGPLHNGPSGAFQTVFDALKLLSKEDFEPAGVESTIFTLAPALVFVSAFILMAVIPFAPGWVFANVETGALFIIAAGTLGSYGTLLAGWSMNNKFGLLGGLRAAAQLVSYEVPLSLALLSVAVFSGTMNLTGIVESQLRLWNFIPMFIPFVVYLIAGLAEIKMTPFDLPEAESELVAGFNTEYSGMRFGFFFVAEFAELFLLPAILVVFFLGGWHAPVIPWPNEAGFLELVFKANVSDPALATTFWERAFGPGGFFLNLQYSVWFLFKSSLGVYFYLWIRATLPRFRDDQLMELCWKFLIPLSVLGLLIAVVFRLIRIG